MSYWGLIIQFKRPERTRDVTGRGQGTGSYTCSRHRWKSRACGKAGQPFTGGRSCTAINRGREPIGLLFRSLYSLQAFRLGPVQRGCRPARCLQTGRKLFPGPCRGVRRIPLFAYREAEGRIPGTKPTFPGRRPPALKSKMCLVFLPMPSPGQLPRVLSGVLRLRRIRRPRPVTGFRSLTGTPYAKSSERYR